VATIALALFLVLPRRQARTLPDAWRKSISLGRDGKDVRVTVRGRTGTECWSKGEKAVLRTGCCEKFEESRLGIVVGYLLFLP